MTRIHSKPSVNDGTVLGGKEPERSMFTSPDFRPRVLAHSVKLSNLWANETSSKDSQPKDLARQLNHDRIQLLADLMQAFPGTTISQVVGEGNVTEFRIKLGSQAVLITQGENNNIVITQPFHVNE